ncbi:MAG: YigZ family protein [Marinobacter sp.]|uniref:YigZ family protein n=1 Tax=Marinobacter sp. TaxID=50741 RepID=UPI0029C2BA90|nr:YigZ family protein [Marinobacter sp.]MDX5334912.1 YigZ family protein [Marinobacter sp.]MDX5385584.1 YigZ family protein [Marinobacter sp.]MDX5439407.1 YigZ family protein [Alteromonadaceae bacterium]MDX5471201.1 YigZ family protein [Marinobacter sp.]
MSKDYPVPSGYLERETEVKKSRFIARVYPVSSRDEVREHVARAHQDYPDARHVCWAYQIGRPGSAAEAAMNDDGEPSGTAGKPILNVIQHKDMGDVLVIVVRYFGGIKLGAGGLVRAYAGAAESVLSEVGRTIQQSRVQAEVVLGFADEQPLRHWCEGHEGQIESIRYSDRVNALVSVPETRVGELAAFCDAQKLDYRLET